MVRYFLYRKSRSGQVPKEVLGEEFKGVVACDFYAGYNKLGVLQRCWFHLLKDAKELAEINADRPEVVAWVEALGALYEEAKVRCKQRRRLEKLAVQLARPYAEDANAPQRVLAQRIRKQLHELFVFISDPAVPATNDLAERSLRPAVVARKISGGHPLAQGLRHQDGADESVRHLDRARQTPPGLLPATAPAHPNHLTPATAPKSTLTKSEL